MPGIIFETGKYLVHTGETVIIEHKKLKITGTKNGFRVNLFVSACSLKESVTLNLTAENMSASYPLGLIIKRNPDGPEEHLIPVLETKPSN